MNIKIPLSLLSPRKFQRFYELCVRNRTKNKHIFLIINDNITLGIMKLDVIQSMYK